MTEKYQAPSVKKAFQILNLLADSENGLGISELAKSLGISKSTVHGITSALEEIEVIDRNPLNKKYNLGLTMVELGKKGISRIPLRVAARRYLEGLMREIGETVFLGVPKDGNILILDVVESGKELKITSPSGAKIPLTAGAAGKVFLAFMEEQKAHKFLIETGLVKYTKNTITEIHQYFQELKKVRTKSYATDYEEYLRGIKAVAARIESKGPGLAAIWVVGFSSSLTEDKMPWVIERTVSAAQEISRELERGE